MCVVLSKGSIQDMGLPVSNNAACDGHGNPSWGLRSYLKGTIGLVQLSFYHRRPQQQHSSPEARRSRQRPGALGTCLTSEEKSV